MHALRPLFPLLLAAGILLAGNGLQGTLIALRGAQEGFASSMIGLMGTAYFGGFLLGCIYTPALLQSVGHIRTFSALAAIAAASSLTLVLLPDATVWMAIRFVSGFCFAGLFATVEGWLNAGVNNDTRGRVLSLYRLIDIGAVTGAQFLIPALGPGGFAVFAVMSILITLSLVPVSLADRSNPKPPDMFRLDLKAVWAVSPMACIGCLAIGMTGPSFRLVGPIYAQSVGFSVADVATFMSAGIIGGAVLQYPLGYLSDRYDRRHVLIAATAGAALAGSAIAFAAGSSLTVNLIGIFAFGAFSLPLYSLSAAHANDHAQTLGVDYVQIAAGLMLFFSIGAMVGPPLSAFLMEQFGARSLFSFTSVIHVALIAVTLWRMRIRGAVPAAERGRFTTLLRTSPDFAKLARKNGEDTDGGADS